MAWLDDDCALINSTGRYTWAQCREAFQRDGGILSATGGKPGHRIPLSNAHSVLQLSLICGAWSRECIPVPINPKWPQNALDDAMQMISREGPSIRPFRLSESGESALFVLANHQALGAATDEEQRAALEKGMAVASSLPPFFERDGDTEAIAIFTSGSTGKPRAAVLSFRNLAVSADAANRAIPLGQGDRWLLSLPLYHVGGIGVLMRCARSGATIVIPDPKESLQESFDRYAPTQVSLVATQLYRLLRDEKSAAAIARCKAVVMGGGPTPEGLVREAVARGIKLVMSYGMTETAAMICCTRSGDSVERLLSSGKPLVGDTVSISADGEILVRGDQLFIGYLQPDGSVQRPLTEDGWFRTGDLGHFDEAGYLHVTGRRDNMFISGGENIQPEEIEAALRAIAGVEEAIVVPVESAEWGKRPVAFVRMDEGRALDAAAIGAMLRGGLPGYKVPRTIHAWPVDLVQPGLKPARRDFEKRARDLATD